MSEMHRIPYKDLHSLPEDERIKQIGEKAMKERLPIVGFFVDDFKKADQYIAKLKAAFPDIRLIEKPVMINGIVLVKVGPPAN